MILTKFTQQRAFALFLIFCSITINSFSITLHLKPNGANGKDAYLDMPTPNSNYGNHTELPATAWTCGASYCKARGIIQFDLSSIPPHAIVTSATISLFANTTVTSIPPPPMRGINQAFLQRVLAPWSESTVTWNNVPAVTLINQVVLPTSTSTNQNYLNVDVKNLIQDMVYNPATSFGFHFRLEVEDPYASMIFASSDHPDPTKWPEITIEYEIPSITTLPLTQTVLCPGSFIQVNYNSSIALPANNVFTAQLSNAAGSFGSPVNIGAISSSVSGSIPSVLPLNIPPGNGYRIRVVSSYFSLEGSDNGSNLSFLVQSDNNLCTIDACDPGTGVVSHTLINVNDNNACTIDACDPVSGISHTAVVVDDNNACTNDGCNAITGVFHDAIDISDNDACTIDACDVLTGAISHTPVNVSDNNACTIDACDPSTGIISHTVVNYNDNNMCTFDGCDFITGVFHISVNIDDGNACTEDACNMATGFISHLPVNTDDYDLCTIDACDPVTGISHSSVSVDDNNLCTIDGCDPINGVFHNPIDIDDSDACTADYCDPATGNITYSPANTDDGDPCTMDECDHLTGAISHILNAPVISLTLQPVLCYGDLTCITVGASGGQSPYSGDGTFCNYGAGIWPFSVTDTRGCVVESTIEIVQPEKLLASVVSTNTACDNNNGSASVSTSGGTIPYTCEWSPGGETDSTISGLSPGNYIVTCTDANGCTASATASIGVIGTPPSMPGTISGTAGACRNQTLVQYTVSPVPGATAYVWSLPAGASGSSNTNSILVSFSGSFSGGFICVNSVNPCGTSSSSCRNISVITTKPGSIAQITGPAHVCSPSVVTYCISSVANATNYVWSFGGNGGSNPLTILSGQGTPCITVNVPAGYNGNQQVKVKAENCIGSSGTRKKDVRKSNIPNTPGSISGSTSVCHSSTSVYSVGSVSGASSYAWNVTGGAMIVSGQGTKNIAVNFSSSTGTNAVVTVAAVNVCGTSPVSSRTVSINQSCKKAEANYLAPVNIQEPIISVFPNPSSGLITLVIPSVSEGSLTIKVTDLTGKTLHLENLNAIEGDNHVVMNLSHLSKGIYLLNVEGNSFGRKSLRVIIE